MGREAHVDAILIASVNPPIARTVAKSLRRRFGVSPAYVGADIPVPMRVRCRRPERVGVDRLLNAVGARSLVQGPAIVADFGTAVTIDAVSSRGQFLGGTILPGISLSAQALQQGTAKLPRVSSIHAGPVIGKDTDEAIRSGIFWGTCGAAGEIVQRMRRRLRDAAAKLVITGGDAPLFAKHLPTPNVMVPHLTLDGIAAVFYSSRGGAG
jgi:type III pantothenate kinase